MVARPRRCTSRRRRPVMREAPTLHWPRAPDALTDTTASGVTASSRCSNWRAGSGLLRSRGRPLAAFALRFEAFFLAFPCPRLAAPVGLDDVLALPRRRARELEETLEREGPAMAREYTPLGTKGILRVPRATCGLRVAR